MKFIIVLEFLFEEFEPFYPSMIVEAFFEDIGESVIYLLEFERLSNEPFTLFAKYELNENGLSDLSDPEIPVSYLTLELGVRLSQWAGEAFFNFWLYYWAFIVTSILSCKWFSNISINLLISYSDSSRKLPFN